MIQLPCPCHNKIHDPNDRFDDMEIPAGLDRRPKTERVPSAPLTPTPEPFEPFTEPTEQGLQFVIPGCEKRQDRRVGQLEMF